MASKVNIRPIYHNHIPRTAGTNILYSLQRAQGRLREAFLRGEHHNEDGRYADLRMYNPDILEFMYDSDKMRDFNYISGHFATNPIHEIENVLAFSFVRNPVDQFVSTAAYRCLSARIDFTPEILDAYIAGHYQVWGEFEGFSGISNPQSHFLSSRFAKFELENSNRADGSTVGMAFISSPKSLDDVRQFTDDMIIGTVENRHLVLEKINKVMRKQFGIEIPNDTRKINSNLTIRFEISPTQMKRMKEKLELDEEVYQHVKEREKKDA